MSANESAAPPAGSSGLSFTQGFLLGQLSVALFLAAFIKFFIFGEPPASHSSGRGTSGWGATALSTLSPTHRRTISFTPSSASRARAASAVAAAQQASTSHIVRPPPALTAASILAKAYYNVAAHQPESLDWFNVLVGQALAQVRTDAAAGGGPILATLSGVLNGTSKPEFVGEIAVTEVALGEEFPIFSNCRVHRVDDDRLQALMDVDLADAITLGIETTAVLNYPRPRTAVLPVALSVSVLRFSGTLAISFLPAAAPPSGAGLDDPFTDAGPKRTPTSLAFSFQPTYTLSLSTRSLLGARSRLQDVPKIAQLVEARLRTWFEERCVAPRRQQVVIPSLWPRMKNVVDAGGPAASDPAPGLSMPSPTPQRDPRAEALREIEEDTVLARRRAAAQDAARREWEGLRRRGAADRRGSLDMPGPMPGAMVG